MHCNAKTCNAAFGSKPVTLKSGQPMLSGWRRKADLAQAATPETPSRRRVTRVFVRRSSDDGTPLEFFCE